MTDNRTTERVDHPPRVREAIDELMREKDATDNRTTELLQGAEGGGRMMYKFGDWVVYDPGYKQQIGRVTECREHSAFVCYSLGCTAASTPLEYLRPATEAEIDEADAAIIGYNRFQAYCPSWDELACVGCKAKRMVNE